ncbi:MAG: phosphate acyltransferase, partial [Gemmatimonadaceae bacterium]
MSDRAAPATPHGSIRASFLDTVHARARAAARTIVFPEATDPRTLAAVATLAAEGIVRPVLVVADGATV